MSKLLTLAQSGYDLLVLLAISDSHYHGREALKINAFIKSHFNIKGFSATPMYYFLEMTEKERLDNIVAKGKVFAHEGKNKYKMIDFAYALICADHKITIEEKQRFEILEQVWSTSSLPQQG